MNDGEKILLELKMLDKGIVPNTDFRKNVDDQLSLVPPDEARASKRKFRKLKRQAMKKLRTQSSRASVNRLHEKFSVIQMLARDRNT